MAALVQLIKIYGDDDGLARHTYLANKHRGGLNNAKGNSFENHFAVYKISTLIGEGDAEYPTLLSSQVLRFVDDLVIERPNNAVAEHYQIKDVERISWQTGSNYTIEDDFNMEITIAEQTQTKISCNLVVSQKDVYDHLVASMPDNIRVNTSVIHFNKATTINQLLTVNAEFKAAISNICALNNPSTDKLESLATIILGVWEASGKQNISVSALLDNCRSINPHYIKGLSQKISLPLDTLLRSIAGFNYLVENGYLVWRYKTTDSGTVAYTVGSDEFMQLENDICNIGRGISFEDLEHYLSKEYGKGI